MYRARLDRLAAALAERRLDCAIISPGPDLRYLVGYDAVPLERLTALVVPAAGPVWMLVPELETAAALASPVGVLDLPVVAWREGEDAFAHLAKRLPDCRRYVVDGRMWADKLLKLMVAMPNATAGSASEVIASLRMRKTDAEVAALQRAASLRGALDTAAAASAQPRREKTTQQPAVPCN